MCFTVTSDERVSWNEPGTIWMLRPMAEQEPISNTCPLFSIVIPVFNDWALLDRCLQSVAQQKNGACFDVVIVDDGSSEPVPDFIRRWNGNCPLTVIRESHAGISAARNRGVQSSRGAVLVFVDADCTLQPDCLAALSSAQRSRSFLSIFVFSCIWWEIVPGWLAERRSCGSLRFKITCFNLMVAFDI